MTGPKHGPRTPETYATAELRHEAPRRSTTPSLTRGAPLRFLTTGGSMDTGDYRLGVGVSGPRAADDGPGLPSSTAAWSARSRTEHDDDVFGALALVGIALRPVGLVDGLRHRRSAGPARQARPSSSVSSSDGSEGPTSFSQFGLDITDPVNCVFVAFQAHLRRHHRRAHQRCDRRSGEVLGVAGVPAALGHAVYFPLAHQVWGGGFLSGVKNGLADFIFSGDVVPRSPDRLRRWNRVHINAGVAGLVLAVAHRQAPRLCARSR